MQTNCHYIPYAETGFFSNIVLDYIAKDEKLKPFYQHEVSYDGLRKAVEERKKYNTDRTLLVNVLRQQYEDLALSALQKDNIEALLQPHTFTVTTAHQPNIFTGHLYFIYKILHTIILAADLNKQMPENKFVPVYYMGSEDADLDELGHINLEGEKLEWKTKQTGAVGRMVVDKAFQQLIDVLAGRLEVEPFGKELIQTFRSAYTLGRTIQQATLYLVNELFKDYGLLVIVPDNAALKGAFAEVVKKELTQQFSHSLVEEISAKIGSHYKVQASGRELNLFYLADNHRERIEKNESGFEVNNLKLSWTEAEVVEELEQHPERFSANVILRGVFQETILPNIAFIGGGGELAYWLELKSVFEHCQVPFPVLILRNSFLLVQQNQLDKIVAMGFTLNNFFFGKERLLEQLVKKESSVRLTLVNEQQELARFYDGLSTLTDNIDLSLHDHITALKTRSLKLLQEVERKMLRAEKRKYGTQQRQIGTLKEKLFPNNSLQERVDNFALYYARYGKIWLHQILDHSKAIEPKFGCIVFSTTDQS